MNTLSAALAYSEAGLSIIPVRADGSKAPDVASWKQFQQRRPTGEEIKTWWGNGTARGIAIVWGAVSGNGEALDFDAPGLYEDYAALCREHGHSDLLESLLLVETPSGGRHLLYRCETPVPGNQKLAQRLVDVPEGTDGARKVGDRWAIVETLIETRGEGGYTLAPGSPAECHPDRRTYQFLTGRPAAIPTLTADERLILIALASTFNEYVEPSRVVDAPKPKQGQSGGLRPGDDYNARGEWESLLERHGWRRLRRVGDKDEWQRPGKTGPGPSATGNYAGTGLFYVFSSSAAPFDADKAYSPFAVYAHLEHGGDFTEAARALGKEGFGDSTLPSEKAAMGAIHGQSPQEWEPPVAFPVHALPAFPLEALPEPLAAQAAEVARTIQVPVDMPAITALTVVAAAGGRRCQVEIWPGFRETLNLYTVQIMGSGGRKTPTDTVMVSPLREAERQMWLDTASAIATAKERRDVDDKRLTYLREQAAKAKDARAREEMLHELGEIAAGLTDPPAAPRLLADDVTPEKMAGLLAQQNGALAIFSSEGGLFGILAGRYSDGNANLDLFLKAYSGETYRVDRQGRPPVFVPRACLTVGLAVQPSVLASLSSNREFLGRGLLGRFLYSIPQELVGTRLIDKDAPQRSVDPAVSLHYSRTIQQILDLPLAATADDPSVLHLLTLSDAARAVWVGYYNDVERRQAEGGDLSGMRDWASKLSGTVARIAGGLHLAEHATERLPWDTPITPKTMAAAWAIGEYFIPHAQAAYGQMAADPNTALAQRIHRWIGRMGLNQFTKRTCHQVHRVDLHKELTPALVLLCEHGYLRQQEPPLRQGKGQSPSPVYDVNPHIQNTQNTHEPPP